MQRGFRSLPATFDEDCLKTISERAIKFRWVNPPHRVTVKKLLSFL